MINSPSVLAALAPSSPAAAPGGTWTRVARRGLKRPRGLWKARRRLDPATTATTSNLAQHQHQLLQTPDIGGAKSCSSGRGSDTDREMESCGEGEGEEEEDGDEDGDDMSQNSNSSKRQRRDSGGGSSTSSNNKNMNKDYSSNIPMELWAVYVDSEAGVGGAIETHDRLASTCGAGGHGIPPGENSDIASARRVAPLISNMATTSIAERAPPGATKETYEYSDWEEIKEMLTWASELCDRAWLVFMPVLSPQYNPPRELKYCRRRPGGLSPVPQGGRPRVSPLPGAIPGPFPVLLSAVCPGTAPCEVLFARVCPRVRGAPLERANPIEEEHDPRIPHESDTANVPASSSSSSSSVRPSLPHVFLVF